MGIEFKEEDGYRCIKSELCHLKYHSWNSRKFSKLLHFEVFLNFQYNCRANVCICFAGIFNFSTRNSIQSKGWRWWYRCCLKRVKHTNWLLRSGVKMKFCGWESLKAYPFWSRTRFKIKYRSPTAWRSRKLFVKALSRRGPIPSRPVVARSEVYNCRYDCNHD